MDYLPTISVQSVAERPMVGFIPGSIGDTFARLRTAGRSLKTRVRAAAVVPWIELAVFLDEDRASHFVGPCDVRT